MTPVESMAAVLLAAQRNESFDSALARMRFNMALRDEVFKVAEAALDHALFLYAPEYCEKAASPQLPSHTFWLGADAEPSLVSANGAKLNVVMWPEGMPVWACSYFKSVWDNLQRQGAT